MSWKPTDFSIPPTTAPSLVPSTGRAHWAQLPKFLRVAWRPVEPWASTGGGSTVTVFGAFETERLDMKDYPKPFNFNSYPAGFTTSGEFVLARPQKTTWIAHHSSAASTWMDGLAQ